VLITRQMEGAIVPIPCDELMDPATGRTRVRMVDISTASHASAWALQVRIEPRDLEDRALLETIARTVKLPAEQVKARYAPICR
jgi:6-phosphofructokinase 1